MPYRGLLYFVSQSASSDYRSDPYATERRSLPNRTHGIRYASAPKRSTCIRTYAPSETVRPVCASSTTAASQASRSVEPQRMLKAVFAMVLVAVLSAFLGIFAAHALSAAIDDGAFPLIGSADAATGNGPIAPTDRGPSAMRAPPRCAWPWCASKPPGTPAWGPSKWPPSRRAAAMPTPLKPPGS